MIRITFVLSSIIYHSNYNIITSKYKFLALSFVYMSNIIKVYRRKHTQTVGTETLTQRKVQHLVKLLYIIRI